MRMQANRMLRGAAYVFSVWLALISIHAAADDVALNANPPQRYTVVPHDTLWGVAGRFLRDPWRWHEVWKANPAIKNPDLIYPGDVIVLRYNHGTPELHVERGSASGETQAGARGSTVKLSPEVRSSGIARAIPTIPVESIRQFLTQPRVVRKEEMTGAPYIVAAADEHVMAAAGDRVYVRGITQSDIPRFMIYRLGDAYHNASSETASTSDADILGYEAIYVGDAKLEQAGDPATFGIVRSNSEVRSGDRLLPSVEQELEQAYQPHAPAADVSGRIIAVVNGVSRIGQGNIVVLNIGTQQGIETGHMLAVYQTGKQMSDPYSKTRGDSTKLPDERVGTVMVFRTFERVSYALVMQAKGPMHRYDMVKNP
ncbi:MAG: LysM domain-containing protein [Proteobacteria bacterium]|nr:LysM domain-containing protein [Pseudomonadota bacterium]